MKYLLSIFLILTLSFQGYSQKKGKKKPVAKTTSVPDLVLTPEMVAKAEKIIPDTLHIQKGKKYVFLIDANENSSKGYTTVYQDNDEESEKTELKRNFPKENLEIINITKYTYVLFENKQTLDITGDGQSFQAFAYWSGKIDDKVQVKEGTRMATEFVAEQLKSKKESSYVVNTRKYKKEVAALLSKNKITSESKEVMKHWLNSQSLPFVDIETNNLPVCQMENAKLKTLDSYFLKKKGVRIPLKSISFNREGLPTSTTYYDEGKVNSKRTFVYNDGLLTKIIDGENQITPITYNDNKMIIYDIVNETDAIFIFWLENGKILEKRYILMRDDKFSYMNSYSEEKIENNCISRYINTALESKDCSGQNTLFPYEHTTKSFQNGEVIHYVKSKLEKKGERTFEKYYSEAKHPDQNDNYKLWGTFYLDNFNLLETYNFIEDKEAKTIKIDYTYYE
ncbi:hypothetical protein [Flavobacterium ajazii]|uniref:hypothetical protein n=1 Tax=Flavobacterium ajazii TaxID=2692318 RepID=UPI0013D44A69|nr:hypothetical protein [Flavobacterium ajazii]